MTVSLLDASAWPLVRIYPERVRAMAEFEALVASWTAMLVRPGRFALISFGDHPEDEEKAVGSARARFFRANRDVFCDRCAVIVGVEANASVRAARNAEADGARRSLGFNIVLAESEAEALAIASLALGEADVA